MANYGQTILLTGATGQVGGAALRALTAPDRAAASTGADGAATLTGADGAATLTGAGPAAASAAVRVLAREAVAVAGAEVAIGSFEDVGSLRAALDGVSVLFLTGRDNPAQVEQHLRVLDVAAAAGVPHVVKLSALGARADSPVALMRWHAAVEEQLRGSSFAWTLLRPHLYMQNLLRFAGPVS